MFEVVSSPPETAAGALLAPVFDFHDHHRGISAVTFDWDLEINNNEFAVDEEIVEAIQSINDAEGE